MKKTIVKIGLVSILGLSVTGATMKLSASFEEIPRDIKAEVFLKLANKPANFDALAIDKQADMFINAIKGIQAFRAQPLNGIFSDPEFKTNLISAFAQWFKDRNQMNAVIEVLEKNNKMDAFATEIFKKAAELNLE